MEEDKVAARVQAQKEAAARRQLMRATVPEGGVAAAFAARDDHALPSSSAARDEHNVAEAAMGAVRIAAYAAAVQSATPVYLGDNVVYENEAGVVQQGFVFATSEDHVSVIANERNGGRPAVVNLAAGAVFWRQFSVGDTIEWADGSARGVVFRFYLESTTGGTRVSYGVTPLVRDDSKPGGYAVASVTQRWMPTPSNQIVVVKPRDPDADEAKPAFSQDMLLVNASNNNMLYRVSKVLLHGYYLLQVLRSPGLRVGDHLADQPTTVLQESQLSSDVSERDRREQARKDGAIFVCESARLAQTQWPVVVDSGLDESSGPVVRLPSELYMAYPYAMMMHVDAMAQDAYWRHVELSSVDRPLFRYALVDAKVPVTIGQNGGPENILTVSRSLGYMFRKKQALCRRVVLPVPTLIVFAVPRLVAVDPETIANALYKYGILLRGSTVAVKDVTENEHQWRIERMEPYVATAKSLSVGSFAEVKYDYTVVSAGDEDASTTRTNSSGVIVVDSDDADNEDGASTLSGAARAVGRAYLKRRALLPLASDRPQPAISDDNFIDLASDTEDE
jgi:hypothetical protein